ncbi:MAG: penicillin-binding protein, partial [Sphingomonas sp.]
MASDPSPNSSTATRRTTDRLRGSVARVWASRWTKAALALFGLGLIALFGFWLIVVRDLPSVDTLRTYEPPLPTNVRGIDGAPIHSYARERRVELSFAEYPPMLINAFLAAEDKSFFEHHGVDFPGLAGAVFDYVSKIGSGRRARGGSTITQQVAKNLLIGNEYSPTRKLREAVLAYKIEDTLTKPQILELYLNQIALGRNAFGVEAASHAYFDKDLDQLDLAQIAYLAILPKGPSNYDPVRYHDRAMTRRNYVLDRMLENGFITRAQFDAANAEPLGVVLR